jgi:Resolvase, N terminal domain
MLAGIAEFERELTQERIRSGIAAAKARGKRLGRQPGRRPKSDRLAPHTGCKGMPMLKCSERELSADASVSDLRTEVGMPIIEWIADTIGSTWSLKGVS